MTTPCVSLIGGQMERRTGDICAEFGIVAHLVDAQVPRHDPVQGSISTS
jgi:hypothetical protein